MRACSGNMSAQTALLTDGKMSSGAIPEKGTSVTLPVTCKGMTGRLMITAGDGVTFSPSMVIDDNFTPLVELLVPQQLVSLH